MTWMRHRLSKDEGFTLIELMVVVLIIAVLVAIAIPSFLGFRSRAQDRSAQADLRNALLTEKGYWIDNGAFTETEADLKDYESSLVANNTSASDPGVYVDMSVTGNDVICIAQASDSGNHYMIFNDESPTGGTFYGASASAITCPTTAGAPTSTATVNWSATGFPTVP